MVYELNIMLGCKKIMLKSNRDPTYRYKVIIEKPTYAGDEMHSSYCCISWGLGAGGQLVSIVSEFLSERRQRVGLYGKVIASINVV